jgi:hypothetical protein
MTLVLYRCSGFFTSSPQITEEKDVSTCEKLQLDTAMLEERFDDVRSSLVCVLRVRGEDII